MERPHSPVPFPDDVSAKALPFSPPVGRYYSDCFADRWGERSLNLFPRKASSSSSIRVPKWDGAWFLRHFLRCDSGDNWNGFIEAAFNRGFGHQCRTFGDFGDPIINMLHVGHFGGADKIKHFCLRPTTLGEIPPLFCDGINVRALFQ